MHARPLLQARLAPDRHGMTDEKSGGSSIVPSLFMKFQFPVRVFGSSMSFCSSFQWKLVPGRPSKQHQTHLVHRETGPWSIAPLPATNSTPCALVDCCPMHPSNTTAPPRPLPYTSCTKTSQHSLPHANPYLWAFCYPTEHGWKHKVVR